MSDNAELATLKAELEAVKKQIPRKTVGVEPDGVPLIVCNQVAERAQREILEEKRDAATLAKEAIDQAFAGRPKKQPHRVQKALSPVAAERLAAAKK